MQQTESEAGQQGLVVEREGIALEFSGEPGFDLRFDQLDPKASEGIELMNVRHRPDASVSATVYVPPGKISNFFRRLDRYEQGSTRGQELLDSVAQIRLAAVRAFWTDHRDFPADANEAIWWEVWVRSGNNPQEHDEAFSRFATALADTPFRAGMGYVQFPERLVLLVRGSVNNWSEHPEVLNLIAELRLAKEVPTELVQLTPAEQAQLVADATSRITTASLDAPAVCVLDTGVWRDHPLLQDSLAASDAQAVDPDWGPSDDTGHGTEIAGLTLFGQDLQALIEGGDGHRLTTRLESVKILPPRGSNDAANYGHVTQKGVARAEAAQPRRPRTVCLAVTADDRDQGYPSSWSGAIDEHAAGVLDGRRRLYVVSTGNNLDVVRPKYEYPTSNHTDAGIQDPAQGWNAITVGAYTDCVNIRNPDFEGWRPMAPAGGLSPTSRTSMMWAERDWPLKPDIVMEGGNWAIDADAMVSPCIDLELLTTTSAPSGRLLDTMRDTSAATAQAARMASLIQAQYPDLWPETVRALLVHSARWTDQMRSEFPSDDQETLQGLLRCYGYGVPDLDQALWSMENQVDLPGFVWVSGR
ncbi:MAG: S8 family peptidase [Pirellulales bacterium]